MTTNSKEKTKDDRPEKTNNVPNNGSERDQRTNTTEDCNGLMTERRVGHADVQSHEDDPRNEVTDLQELQDQTSDDTSSNDDGRIEGDTDGKIDKNSNWNNRASSSDGNDLQDQTNSSTDTNKKETKLEINKDVDKENSFPKLSKGPDQKLNPIGWIPLDTRMPRKMSTYLHNIAISSSNGGLTLNNGDKKETTLLTDSKTVVRFSPVWKQTLASAASTILTISSGLTSGYSSVLLPQLRHENNAMLAGDDTASWIAAMAALPMGPGCLISGWMMERFGRRTSLYITCIPLFLGWLFIACSYNLGLMLIGRFLTGLCAGLLGPLSPVYIAETTDPQYRGFFLAVVALAIAVGIMIAQLIGTFMSWQWTAIICCMFPLVTLVLLTLIPESPTWLISKGRLADGEKAFYWLRGYGNDAKIELKGIIDSKKSLDNEPKMNWKEKLASLKSPELLKPLGIIIVFFVTSQFSGVNAVAFYSIEIVEKAVGTGIDHYSAMLVIDALRVVVSVAACGLSKRFGRRPLCFVSGAWTAASMAGLAAFLHWRPDNMSWLPLTCLMFYICAISIGLVPLPWVMCGEVFPTRVRGLGSGISTAVTFVAFFVVVKTAPGMMGQFGEVVTFLSYGVVALVGTAIMYFILPETKGKSLQEIEEKFKRRKNTLLCS